MKKKPHQIWGIFAVFHQWIFEFYHYQIIKMPTIFFICFFFFWVIQDVLILKCSFLFLFKNSSLNTVVGLTFHTVLKWIFRFYIIQLNAVKCGEKAIRYHYEWAQKFLILNYYIFTPTDIDFVFELKKWKYALKRKKSGMQVFY